ncbi:MAG: GNAT family N-acetyltransferase [Bacteroidetes bacterium]|nr:GNAT family N-acetyltransferase [Bacteroidota bacterium]
MIIRQATGSDGDAIAALLSKSFLEESSVIRISIENNPRYTLSNMYVLEDSSLGKGVLACLRITPFDICSRGVRMPMAGIAAVAVQPEVRRHGLADTLMEDALKKMYEMGFPVSMLFPFRHRFYKKYGYAYVGNMMMYDISPSDIRSFPERSRVRPFNKSDRNRVKKILEQEIQTHGSFTPRRNDSFWDLVVLPKFKEAYIYDDGEAKGYLVYELYKEPAPTPGAFGEPIINIKELVGLDAAAHRGLWGFVSALGEQVSRVKFLGPADYPLHLFLKEPREKDYDRLFFEYKSFSTLAPGFMMRVINVRDALSRLRHGIESPADFVLKINDGNLPQNSRPVNVHVHEGETAVDDTGSTVQFESDIEVFSQIYSGFLRPSDAVRYGFATGDASVLSKLDELFRAPLPFIYQFDIF